LLEKTFFLTREKGFTYSKKGKKTVNLEGVAQARRSDEVLAIKTKRGVHPSVRPGGGPFA